jgi:Domain of Unknown Function (DUF1206)
VGRVALVAQGVLYLVLGLLAVQVARGQTQQADQRGALETVVRQPAGSFLLAVLIVGLALHSLWRLTLAVRGEPGDDEDAGEVAKRAMELGRAVVAGAWTIAAVKVWADSRSAGTGNSPKRWTATVLDWRIGVYLVGGFGLVVVGTGCWHLSKAFTRRYLKDLDLAGRRPALTNAVTVLGAAGWAARGAVYALSGWFLLTAARDHDPNRAAGIDETLKRLVAKPAGPTLLGAVAVGLTLFGVFRMAEGWLRRPGAVSHA